jgi:hypothetical protein
VAVFQVFLGLPLTAMTFMSNPSVLPPLGEPAGYNHPVN